MFDFSNYAKDSRFSNETNIKVIGKMKHEFGGIIVSEFVGLKTKMYSIKRIDGNQLSLISLKMFYLIKKLLDTKWKEFKVKNIN